MTRLDRALAVTGSVALAATLSACSFFSPVQTDQPYNPGDGVPADLGVVSARNLAVIAEKEGGKGTLTGAVLNTSDSQVQVGFLTREASEAGSAPARQLDVGGRQVQRIDGVVFDKVPVAPGAMTDIYLVTPEGRQLVSVPVLLPLGPYATYRP